MYVFCYFAGDVEQITIRGRNFTVCKHSTCRAEIGPSRLYTDVPIGGNTMCQCHRNCLVRGTCCLRYIHPRPEYEHHYQRLQRASDCTTRYFPLGYDVSVVSRCPNGTDPAVKAACEADPPKPKTVADYTYRFPRQRNYILYKNQACFECNSQCVGICPKVSRFSHVSFLCNNELIIRSGDDIPMKIVAAYCDVSFSSEFLFYTILNKCFKQYTCSEQYEPEVYGNCETFLSPIFVKSSTYSSSIQGDLVDFGRISGFKNPYCMMCRNVVVIPFVCNFGPTMSPKSFSSVNVGSHSLRALFAPDWEYDASPSKQRYILQMKINFSTRIKSHFVILKYMNALVKKRIEDRFLVQLEHLSDLYTDCDEMNCTEHDWRDPKSKIDNLWNKFPE